MGCCGSKPEVIIADPKGPGPHQFLCKAAAKAPGCYEVFKDWDEGQRWLFVRVSGRLFEECTFTLENFVRDQNRRGQVLCFAAVGETVVKQYQQDQRDSDSSGGYSSDGGAPAASASSSKWTLKTSVRLWKDAQQQAALGTLHVKAKGRTPAAGSGRVKRLIYTWVPEEVPGGFGARRPERFKAAGRLSRSGKVHWESSLFEAEHEGFADPRARITVMRCLDPCLGLLAGFLPTPPAEWYVKLNGNVPMATERNATLREAWQTRWVSVDKMYTPAITDFGRAATKTTTWMDRRRSVTVGWMHDYIASSIAEVNFSWPLCSFATSVVTWSFNGTSSEEPCGASGCDVYISTPDNVNMLTIYIAYYRKGTNIPVKMYGEPLYNGGGVALQVNMTVVEWRVGSAIPPVPEFDGNKTELHLTCADKKDQTSCGAVMGAYCTWCSNSNTCVLTDSANATCKAPACSTYKIQGQCPTWRCNWCDGTVGCTSDKCVVCNKISTGAACNASSGACTWCPDSSFCTRVQTSCPYSPPKPDPQPDPVVEASSSSTSERSSSSSPSPVLSSSSSDGKTHADGLPCSAHVVALTQISDVAWARDEIWKDHDAFAWRTQFWAVPKWAGLIGPVMPNYDRTTVWRDDLSKSFNFTNATCRTSALVPRTFMFGPLNFSALTVLSERRNVEAAGISVDIKRAVGGKDTLYDIVYAAGTSRLMSINGTFFFEFPGVAQQVNILVTVKQWETGLPVADSAFSPSSRCSGTHAQRPAASEAFKHSCYESGSEVHHDSGASTSTVIPTTSSKSASPVNSHSHSHSHSHPHEASAASSLACAAALVIASVASIAF
eukprot:m51a1_g9307 hypothetical protein (834) ;mRNA; f:83729-87452